MEPPVCDAPPRNLDLDAEARRFGGELDLRCLPPDFRTYRMLGPVFYASKRLGVLVFVPKGAEHDFASVPRLLWWLLPPAGRYAPAAVVHDWLYRTHRVAPGTSARSVTRGEADGVFLDAMADVGVGRITRYAIWLAVRCFGACSFHSHTTPR